MKQKIKIIYRIEIMIAFYIMVLATIISKEFLDISKYTNIFFFLLLTIVEIQFFSLNKKEKQINRLTSKNILIYNLGYFLILYLSGLFLGFLKTAYSLNIIDILLNILPIIIYIIYRELLRELVIKNTKSKLAIAIFVVEIILIEIISSLGIYSLENPAMILKTLGVFIIPTILEQLLLTYICFNSNYKSSTLYALLQHLWIYVVPFKTDLTDYLQFVITTIFPVLVFLSLNNLYSKYNKETQKEISPKYKYFIYTPILIILSVLVILISGITKYQIVAVGSGSMEPQIYRGDAVIINKLKEEEFKKLQIGDVLAFTNNNQVVMHRITKIDVENNLYTITTKGDNNKKEDNFKITNKKIIGIVKVRIPFIGYPTLWFNKK